MAIFVLSHPLLACALLIHGTWQPILSLRHPLYRNLILFLLQTSSHISYQSIHFRTNPILVATWFEVVFCNPKWFERIPGRWILSALSPEPSPTDSITSALLRFSFGTTASVEVEYVGNSKTIKKPGWTVASELCAVKDVLLVYGPSPNILFDIKDCHRQCKIKFSKVDKKQADQGACKMCTKYKLTQKKLAYLCVECGDFFCHDTLPAKNQQDPCCCFYAHMCLEHINSGVADNVFRCNYDCWNNRRLNRCREMDGK